MTYLGIDYGTKRIGLAVAHDETRVASPIGTLAHDDVVFERLADIIREREVGAVVLGVPVSGDGKEYAFAERVRAFGDEIVERCTVSLYTIDEAFTSDAAGAAGARDVDAAAAALILQSWLDEGSEKSVR